MRLSGELRKEIESDQQEIAAQIVLDDRFSEEVVAGVDLVFLEGKFEMIISGAVALGPDRAILDCAHSVRKARIPYVPGYLSYREGPVALEALERLRPKPTLLFVNRCGINHPRRAGLASWLGVVLDMPTVGVTKNPLCGSWIPTVSTGDASPLFCGEEILGHVFRSKDGCRPIVVAPGHRVSVGASLDLARRYLRGHKIPEPCRLARLYARKVKRDMDHNFSDVEISTGS